LLLILVVTAGVVAAAYYGFSRLAATSTASADGANASRQPARNVASRAPSPQPQVAVAAPQHAPAPPAAPPPGTFAITISNAHPPAPSDVIRVDKDDPVTLSITSDRSGHVEVHGYRKEVAVEPGRVATLSFKAVRTGRFPIDLHGSDGAHVEVTALEVMPR
jgi:hypothetical protein